MNKKIIIFGTSFLVAIFSFFNLIKNNSHHQQKLLKKQNKSIPENEFLTSYFIVLLFLTPIYYLLTKLFQKFHLNQDFRYQNNHHEEIDYLSFILIVLEMIACNNCTKLKKGDLYKKKLTFDPMDFLNKFLFNQQKQRLEQTKALKTVNYYRKKITLRKSIIFYFFKFFLSYLFIFIINLGINFSFHGKKLGKD